MNKFVLHVLGVIFLAFVLPFGLSYLIDWLWAYVIVGICLLVVWWQIVVRYRRAERNAKRGKLEV
jgi:hypothetical protein